jgi:hypothetical protein
VTRQGRTKRIHRLAFATAALALVTASLAWGCKVTPLDIGTDNPVVQDDHEVPDTSMPDVAEADATLSLESRLRARCAEDPGPSDDYFSAADLTSRLVARWFNCDAAAASPIQDGDGDGIVFQADGSWALLFWNESRTDFVASTTPQQFGMFRYYFFVDSEAGAAGDSGVSSGDIARDDTKARSPLVVYLDRQTGEDGFSHTFSQKPRQMKVGELASPLRARYVPID